MKNEKRIIVSLLMVLVLALSMLATGCQKKEPDIDDLPKPTKQPTVMTLDLNSDSANGEEWLFNQDDELFVWSDTFLVDEGSEEGSGELQSFELRPINAGSTMISFFNQSKDTTYTYEVEVSEDLSTITVKSSNGESGGTKVEAPEPVIEKN